MNFGKMEKTGQRFRVSKLQGTLSSLPGRITATITEDLNFGVRKPYFILRTVG